MKNYIEFLNFVITELKQTENKTLYDILLCVAIAFFIDIFYLRNHLGHYEILWIIRSVYCSLGFLSLFCLRNSYHREKRLKKEQKIRDELNAKDNYKRVFSFLVNKELEIITEFIESKQPVLYLDNLQDDFETFKTYKNFGIIEDSEIANGYIRIKFKKDFIEIIKEKLKQFKN